MENEEKDYVTPEADESEIENESEETTTEDDSEKESESKPKARPKETPEEKLARLEGTAKRIRKDLGLDKQSSKETTGLDRIDRTVLRMEKITAPEEIELVEEYMAVKGLKVEDVIENRIFQKELAQMREFAETKRATPSGSKRSGQSQKDQVDYWIAKGELPSDPALKIQVVNAKIAKERNQSTFTSNPVIK